jgi:hypothetical protein
MMMVVRSIYGLEDRFTTMWAIACRACVLRSTLYSCRQAIQPLVSCPDEGGPKYKSSYWATVHPNFPPNNRTQAVRNYEMTVIKSGVPVRTEDVNGHQIMSFTVTRE